MATARHPKASVFVRQKLFAGLSTFVELEQRIANLPEEKSRGDAFEVFAEAYLATQRKHDAETVWPLTSVPGDVLLSLKLAVQDYGIDGVLKTRLGNHSAYQVKFRTGRPALTWRELSTFMGLADSPNIHSRILLTNCDELPSMLNDRQGFFCIRGTDLDRLEADDFKAIAAWLADSVYQAPRKTPQPHQTEALEKILPAFKEHDRVSAIMACGTGKTLVALWVAENVANAGGASVPASRGGQPQGSAREDTRPTSNSCKILVLLPSLALLRQTLHEWLRETSLPSLAYLCVCSDATVKEGVDALTTAQSDLDFEVSTNSASVRAFLDASFAGTKIIFCTYQSASVVGAAMQAGESFNLGIFDEAHKTAGREGRNFAFALEDKNLPIRKRLFVTATPRHYNPHQRDREGESKLVFSMDKPEVYGEQIYRLTFAEAARRGIICGYKLIISVITSEMVTNELLRRGEVLVNGDAVIARQVANQIALRDAVEKYGTRKIFTFHKTVKSAESFVATGSEGVRTHLPDFKTFHVNGTMPTARREHALRDFRAAPLAVMSNARCLTEGVDVPAVDMVAFLSPRRSLVDIVQATGRAMRPDQQNNKTTGYVLVPLYLEQAVNETVEEAIQRSEFDEVWDVLQAMQEQDEVLAEVIRDMREERGRTNGFDDSRFRERVEVLAPQISFEALRKVITTVCIEKLSASWDEYFGQLKAFRDRFGYCNVSQGWDENPALSFWVSNQRQRNRRHKLSADRVRKLDGLGFVWNVFDAAWEDGFRQLLCFKQKHNDCDVPRGPLEYRDLANWVHTQRRNRKDGKLKSEQIQRLDEQGFVWELFNASWEEMFSTLKEYKRANGNCNVPQGWPTNRRLANWVRVQRAKKAGGTLVDDRIRRLEKEGFIWDRSEAAWDEMFTVLVAHKAIHKNCDVPTRWQENPRLATWVHEQRKRKRKNQLGLERMRRLSSLGFRWEFRDVTGTTDLKLNSR